MPTSTSPATRRTPQVPSRLPVPPPSPMLELRDADTVIGWIDRAAIGFRGFGDEAEAAHAAWVGHRTMQRRFARRNGRRLPPVDTEPMSLGRSGDVELILAGGRPIATLTRPGADSRSGPDSFGFELQLPVPAEELTLRSTAYLIYRTLRRSGIRWAMWAPVPREVPAPGATRAEDRPPAAARSTGAPRGRGDDRVTVSARRIIASRVLATLLVVLAMLTVVVLPAITASTAVVLLGGAAALVALFAVASLVRLVATDVRDTRRGRERPTPRERRRGRRSRETFRARTLELLSRDHPRQPFAGDRALRST